MKRLALILLAILFLAALGAFGLSGVRVYGEPASQPAPNESMTVAVVRVSVISSFGKFGTIHLSNPNGIRALSSDPLELVLPIEDVRKFKVGDQYTVTIAKVQPAVPKPLAKELR